MKSKSVRLNRFPVLHTIGGVPLFYDEKLSAIFYTLAELHVDGDGSPHCYGPPAKKSLDYLANAGHPGNWWALITDSKGVPIVQGANDPAPGYYVSTTSICDPTKKIGDPNRYANSETIPYIAVSPVLFEGVASIKLGDVGIAICGKAKCNFIVADSGNNNEPGEGSIALTSALGLPSNPKGNPGQYPKVAIQCVLLCNTADLLPSKKAGKLMTKGQIDARVTQTLLARSLDPTEYFAAA